MFLAMSIMLIGTLVFQIFPDALLGIFKAEGEMLRIGRTALRIISISFPVAGLCIVMGSTFQAFAKATYSLTVSVGRQLVVLIPVAWLLSLTGAVTNVWWAFPISECMSLIISTFFYRRINRTIIDKL
jgi:Na+-driven multidrug efflux pump